MAEHQTTLPGNDALLRTALDWCDEGHSLAIAIVIQTWGSSPRPVGSIMLVRQDMAIEGSVSGGCVEGAVIDAGLDAIDRQTGQRLDFGVADARAWDVGLSCGGKIAVLVTPVGDGGVGLSHLSALVDAISNRRASHLCLDAVTGRVLSPAHQTDTSFFDDAKNRFHLVLAPPRRVIIIGGVHIAQFLAPMAKQAGYDVMIIDPRAVFASATRFPDTTCIVGWPDEALTDIGLDSGTALVTLTHDPKIDDPALVAALSQTPFYIACLGSRKTHAMRCERLAALGFTRADTDQIHGPAGLDIGARTPAEIAVSILAELIHAHRKQGDL